MNNLEKLIFLEITNKQFTKFPDTEYYSTYDHLSKREKESFAQFSSEIHRIWNFINSKSTKEAIENRKVNSVQDYHNSILPVSQLILDVCSDFSLNLRDVPSQEFKDAVIKIFGLEYYKKNFEKE